MSIAPQINVAAGSLGAFERLALGWQAKINLEQGLALAGQDFMHKIGI